MSDALLPHSQSRHKISPHRSMQLNDASSHSSCYFSAGSAGSGKICSEQLAFTSGCCASQVEAHSLPQLLLRGYVGNHSVDTACLEIGSLVSFTQPVSLAYLDNPTWLCDSIRQASAQVQVLPLCICHGQGCSCLACGSCGPLGDGRNRACPSGRDEWITIYPGLVSLEPVHSQASFQDVDTEMHSQMHPIPGLVCSG